MTSIYALYDPRKPDIPFYVGKGLEKRAQWHWKKFLANGGVAVNKLLLSWFESLKAEGVEPSWQFLEENVSDWVYAERNWIAICRSINPRLCNVAAGGNQAPAYDRSIALHGVKDSFGKSAHAVKMGLSAHRQKDPDGKSSLARKLDKLLHAKKDVDGKSLHARKMGNAAMALKDETGRSVHARKVGAITNHIRWHRERGKIEPNCKLCQEAQSA